MFQYLIHDAMRSICSIHEHSAIFNCKPTFPDTSLINPMITKNFSNLKGGITNNLNLGLV